MFDPIRPHVVLWVQYMVIYTILLALIPSTWISVIWDQIIDPEFDLEHIEQPQNRIIKLFYKASGKINTSVIMRNVVFVVLGVMTMLSSVYDLILTPCLLENPRVSVCGATFYLVTFLTVMLSELHVQMCSLHHGLLHLHQNTAHVQGASLPCLPLNLLPHHIRTYWTHR